MPVSGRVTTADGVEVAFDEAGHGRDVLWLHGLCEHRHAWSPITDRLVPDFRCIRVDFRGHGDSQRLPRYDTGGFIADITAVVEATCSNPPLVVGHSLGGIYATVASALGLTGAVICVDQPLKLGDFARMIHALAPRLRDPESFADALMEEKIALGMELVPQPMFGELEVATRRSDQAVVLDTWSFMLEGDPQQLQANDDAVENLVATITEPYLALHGTPVEPGYEEWLRSTIPGAAFEMWKGRGHWLHLVEIDRFVDRVRAFTEEAEK